MTADLAPDRQLLERFAVSVTGQGAKTTMFAHGFGCDQVMWRYVAPAFEPDHRVVLFDYVGAGGSDLSAYDPENMLRLPAMPMTWWNWRAPSMSATVSSSDTRSAP